MSFNEHVESMDKYGYTSQSDTDPPPKTTFTLSVEAVLSVTSAGTDLDQTIQFSTSGKGAKVGGHLAGGGPCNSDDLVARVNQQIDSQIPGQINTKLKFPSSAISVFALKNLLFPAGNCISFKECAIPGDMLLLGNFKKGNA